MQSCAKHMENKLEVWQTLRGEIKMSDGEKIKNCRQILDIV